MDDLDKFRISIQKKYRLPWGSPTQQELFALIGAAHARQEEQAQALTDAQWDVLVSENISHQGPMHLREGVDFSDLNALLALVRHRAQRAGRS